MSEELADLRLVDAHMRASYVRKEKLAAYVLRIGQAIGWRSDEFVAMAVDAVLAGQTEQALASWEFHETASELADPLGRRLDIDPPVEKMIGAATHAGTPLETVYRRPARIMSEALLSGASQAVAEVRAARTAASLVDTDMSMAALGADHTHALADLRVVGYRRVPNSGACKWCRYIATQRYKVGDLRPAHEYCNCGTREIYGKRDPGPILNKKELERIQREGIPTKYGSGKATKKANKKLVEKAPLGPPPPVSIPSPKLAIPDAPKKPRPDYSKAKDRDEIAKLWGEAHPGFEMLPGGWDTKTARFAAETMEDLVERFPISDEMPLFEWGNIRDVYGSNYKIKRGVQGLARANPVIWDLDAERWVVSPRGYRQSGRIGVATASTKSPKIAEHGKSVGHWSTGEQGSVLVHEYGHHVGYEAELALLRRETLGGNVHPTRGTNYANKKPLIGGNRTAGELWEEAVSQRISDTFGDGSRVRFSSLHATIRDELSDYATTNGREVMAESFAEVFLKGDEARPLARAIVDLALELAEEGRNYR